MSRYLMVVESTATGFPAYSPDQPGCAATGRTRAEVEPEMHDAIEFHIGYRLPTLRIGQVLAGPGFAPWTPTKNYDTGTSC